MKKLILLVALGLISAFSFAQSVEEDVVISNDDNNNTLIIDVSPGVNRDLDLNLYEDGNYSASYRLASQPVNLTLSRAAAEYQVVIIRPLTSDFGIATVVDVDKFNINSVSALNQFFTATCARTEVKYYLIQNVLFEKSCVCNQFVQLGASQFYGMYSAFTLDDYLITQGCQSNGGGMFGKRANPDQSTKYIVPVNNTVAIDNHSAESKTYTIYDMTGKSTSGTVCCDEKIDISTLSAGVYVMKVVSANKQETYKFTK